MEDEVTLWQGDCLELMKDIPDGSVDMILCDLPYGTTACKWDSVIPFEPLWEQYRRVIKRNGSVVLTASQPFTSALVLSNPKWFRYEWVWHKPNRLTGHGNCRKMPMRGHESVLVFYKTLPTYNPQMRAGRPYNRPSGRVPAEILGRTGLQKHQTISEGRRYPYSVVDFQSSNRERGLHPTQKPVALMEYLIRTYTNEGETVLDNCMGSGTTGVACLRTGRRFIGIEKDAKYFGIASERIAAEAASSVKI